LPFKDPAAKATYQRGYVKRRAADPKFIADRQAAQLRFHYRNRAERNRMCRQRAAEVRERAKAAGILYPAQEWARANPARIVAHSKNRKARKREAPGNGVTALEWLEILERHNHRCAYCGMENTPLHQEHMTPLCRGGAHDPTNVVPACANCNFTKGRRTIEEWRASA
jgi:5-methylcytosine-specific restriction endonuclease McrA